MANISQKTKENFIETIAPIVQKYCKQYGYKYASPIIAQACCESAYGTSWISKAPYFNYFGMKCGSKWTGRSVSAKTKEEYTVGKLTSITDNFRAYDSVEQGIEGYFKFISASRYSNLKSATSPQDYLEKIKADGYATSSTYVKTNMNFVTKHNLTQYDGDGIIAVVAPHIDTEPSCYPAYNGGSTNLDTILRTVGVPYVYTGNYARRRKLAEANGIRNYTGTYLQNLKLIELAKSGRLIRV